MQGLKCKRALEIIYEEENALNMFLWVLNLNMTYLQENSKRRL